MCSVEVLLRFDKGCRKSGQIFCAKRTVSAAPQETLDIVLVSACEDHAGSRLKRSFEERTIQISVDLSSQRQ